MLYQHNNSNARLTGGDDTELLCSRFSKKLRGSGPAAGPGRGDWIRFCSAGNEGRLRIAGKSEKGEEQSSAKCVTRVTS